MAPSTKPSWISSGKIVGSSTRARRNDSRAARRDLAKQGGDFAIGRFAIQAAVLPRFVMHVMRHLFRLVRFKLIVNLFDNLPPQLPHLVGQVAFKGEHGSGIRLVVQKTVSPVR